MCYYLEATINQARMPLPIPINSNCENEYDCSETESELDSESSTLTDDDCSDDNFIRFDSNTNYDNVEYVMMCDTCYKLSENNESPIQDDEEEEDTGCLECKHYVIVYFINGYIDQQMMDKNEINDLCRLQGIDISSHDIFKHLLE
jgi:hypothetical protein